MLTFSEFKNQSSLRTLSLREKFFRGMIFNVGQIVEDAQGTYEILDRGTNYVTVVNESGELAKKAIENIVLSEQAMKFESTDSRNGFKGFVPGTKFSSEASVNFSNTVEKFSNGLIEDSIAILKALKAVDRLFESGDLSQVEIARSSLERIGEWDSHKGYINQFLKENTQDETETIKIANFISESLGIKISGSTPEDVVNNALIQSRKGLTTEAATVVRKMLVLVEQSGIKFDASILETNRQQLVRRPKGI
jgi:hypothetical protein